MLGLINYGTFCLGDSKKLGDYLVEPVLSQIVNFFQQFATRYETTDENEEVTNNLEEELNNQEVIHLPMQGIKLGIGLDSFFAL